jgi:ribosomal-protein-alanine N-acetyltransferase
MSAKPVIRLMTFEDMDQVMEIEQKVFADPWSRRSYEFEISGNRFSIPAVLDFQGKIMGHAVVWHVYEEFHIATIAIAPEYQRQGWGKYFLESLLDLATDAEYALLEVRPSNYSAIHIYEKFGFVKVGVRRRYYRNGEDAVIMRKDFKKNPKQEMEL